MASKLDILITARNEASGPINQVKAALGGLGGLATTTVAAAGVAAVGAVTAITGAVAAGVGKAADLEQATADIASVMGLTFDQAKPLSDLITQLGIDPKLKVDATGAADAIMQLAQSGISMTDIMDGAARSTVLLSNATGADMGTAAAVGADAMSLFGIKAKDMAKAVNGITGVTVASKFGIQDYALALAQGGGVAAAVGVSFDDFNTTIAAISPYFAGGSDAGTSFKTMLQRLIPQSNDAKDAMMQLGLITADGKNQFFDANGQMKNMKDIAGLLNTAMSGLSEEQKNAALSTIFGSDAMRAAIAIADAGPAKFDAVAQSIAGIDAEASAATRMNTFGSQMEILQGIMDGLLTQVGQAFLPMMRQLADWATEFATNNGPAIVSWFEGLAAWVTTITPIVTEWAGVLVGAVGEIGAWVQGQQTAFTNLGKLWDALVKATQAAIDAIVAYVADNWQNWADNLEKWALAAWQWIATVAAPKAMTELRIWLASLIRWLQSSAPAWIAALGQWALAAWQWITTDAAPKAMSELQTWSTSIIGWLQSSAPGWIAALGQWALAAWQWIVTDAGPKALLALGGWTQQMLGWLGDHLPDLIAQMLRWATALFTWIGDSIPQMIRAFGDWIESLVNKGETDGTDSIGVMIGKWLHALVDWIWKDLIPKIGPEFAKFLQVMLGALGNIALELATAGAKLGVAIVTSLAEALLGMVGINVNLSKLREDIYATLDSWRPQIQQRGKEIAEALGTGIQSAQNWTSDRWKELMDILHKNLDDGFQMSDFNTIGSDLVKWIQGGIQSVWNLVPDEIQNVAQAAWDRLTTLFSWQNFYDIGQKIMQGLRDGIAGMFGEVLGKINEISNLLPQWLKDKLGIHSPSKVFAGLGEQVMAGLAQGISRGALQPQFALSGSMDAMAGAVTTNNYYNQYNVQLAGAGQAGRDVFAGVQLLRALYG